MNYDDGKFVEASSSARTSLIHSFKRKCTSFALSSSGLMFSGVIDNLNSENSEESPSGGCGGAERTDPDIASL
jgi:hypothetical protein